MVKTGHPLLLGCVGVDLSHPSHNLKTDAINRTPTDSLEYINKPRHPPKEAETKTLPLVFHHQREGFIVTDSSNTFKD